MRNEEFFDSLRQTITGTAEVVGKKTEDILEIQKLRSRIRNAQRNVELDYKKLGEIIYQRYVSGADLDDELTEVCSLIMELQKQTASYKEELANRKGQAICPACGCGNPRDAVFCMHCGALIPKAEPETEDPYAAGPVHETDEAQEVWDACTEAADEAQEAAENTEAADENDIAAEKIQEDAAENAASDAAGTDADAAVESTAEDAAEEPAADVSEDKAE